MFQVGELIILASTVVTIDIVDDDNGPQSVDDTYGCTGSSYNHS